jgi:hypothetical protein
METLAGILFLATFVEGMIQYFAGDSVGATRYWLRYVSLFAGVSLSVAYKINIPELVGISSPYTLVDFIVSGVIIGRGSNYINDMVSHFRKN